jgi:thiamine biosynthesis lipoprotein
MILGFKVGTKLAALICAITFFGFGSCQPETDPYTHIEGKAQGTTFHITYSDSLSRDFSKEIDSLFRMIDQSMSLWDSTSIISRINRNDTIAVPDEHFLKVFNRSKQISEITGGAFDVTVGRLVRAWGFSIKHDRPLPDSATISQMQKSVGYQKVSLINHRIIKSDPDIQLDFNGIAQGYTVDLICDFLQIRGIRNYLVEIGGEVRAYGQNERGTLWQVGIDKPVDTLTEGRPLQTILSLQNKALATSGSYRHYIENKGKKLSHVIDPSTGYPVSHALVSVSVLADDCMTADAFATAFLVMGMEKAMMLASEHHLEIYGIYADQEGNLLVRATSGFLN